MEPIGTTTVCELTEYWGHGPEEWGLPADTDPESTVYAIWSDGGGIMLEVEYAGQDDVPVSDRQTRYIADPDGGVDGFGVDDLPPSVTDRPDRCPECGRPSHVLETRASPEGLRRRRACGKRRDADGCGHRWTTYEREA